MRLEPRDETTSERARERHRLHCGSPVCACDPESMRHCIWLPDEPICSMLRVNEPGVARRMRHIARVAKVAQRPEPDEPGYPGLMDSYFTLDDLRSMRRVDRRMVGRNPDRPRDEAPTVSANGGPSDAPLPIPGVVA